MRDQKVTVNILDPCQEESYLNDHGGNMEDCRAAWEMTLHQFELSNQADRKNSLWFKVCLYLLKWHDESVIYIDFPALFDVR